MNKTISKFTLFCLALCLDGSLWAQATYRTMPVGLTGNRKPYEPFAESKKKMLGNFYSDPECNSSLNFPGLESLERFYNEISESKCYRESIIISKHLSDYTRCECLGFINSDNPGNGDQAQKKNDNILLKFEAATGSQANLGLWSIYKINFEKNAKRIWNDIEGRRNAVALSADLYFNSNADITKYFSNNQKDIQSIINGKKGGMVGAAERVMSNLDSSEQDKQQRKEFKKELEGIKEKVFQFKDATELFSGSIPNPEVNCISPKEYIAYKQLPSFQILTDIDSDYVEEDWDFVKLKEQYNKLRTEPKDTKSPDEKNDIAIRQEMVKEKLEFLNRNPMIKLILQADSKEHLPKKQELMKVLRDYAKKCSGDCQEMGKLKNENDIAFRDALTGFFSREDNRLLVQKLSNEEWQDDLEELKNKNKNTDFSTNPMLSNRNDLIQDFQSMYAGMNPNSCDKVSSLTVRGCNKTYAYYCQYLKDMRVSKFLPDEEEDDLEKILAEGRSIDFSQHKDYEEFNRNVCSKPILKDGKFITFNDFKKSCNDSISLCRKKFVDKYKKEIEAMEDGQQMVHIANFLHNIPVQNMSKEEAKNIAEGNYSSRDKEKFSSSFDTFREQRGYVSKGIASGMTGNEKTTSSVGSPLPVLQPMNDNSSQQFIPGYVNNAVSVPDEEKKTIKDHTRSEQESLLESWKKEMEALQNTPASGPEGEARKLASEKALKERIAALETLLLQQKELSDRQYALLNDALKSREKELEKKISELEKDSEKKVSQGKKDTRTASSESEEGNFFRNPASVMRAPTAYQSGVGSGETAGARAGGASLASVQSSSQAMKEAANREALAREEAKLVKLRQESSGAIVLEGTKGNGANAIALAISDEFYKQARGNLAAINLKQVEKNIPKDQIDLLEKNGVITLILQNGHNPPLEVKVMRRDGQLVQLDNSPAVVRKFSLQGLQNSFRN